MIEVQDSNQVRCVLGDRWRDWITILDFLGGPKRYKYTIFYLFLLGSILSHSSFLSLWKRGGWRNVIINILRVNNENTQKTRKEDFLLECVAMFIQSKMMENRAVVC